MISMSATYEEVRAILYSIPRLRSNGAVVDDKVARAVRRGPSRSRDVSLRCRDDSKVAAVKPCLAGLAEDEIRCAFDVRLRVELSPPLGEYCILEAGLCQ